MGEWLKVIVSLLSIVAPLVWAICAWHKNERKKQDWERHKRKEERYIAFIKSMRGFTTQAKNKELREQFVQELGIAWLHCPDSTIKLGNDFLDSLQDNKNESESVKGERARALAKLQLEMRQEICGETKLTTNDSRLLTNVNLAKK